MEWISVEERLPPIGGAYLVATKGIEGRYWARATMGYRGRWESWYTREHVEGVTHWAEVELPTLEPQVGEFFVNPECPRLLQVRGHCTDYRYALVGSFEERMGKLAAWLNDTLAKIARGI